MKRILLCCASGMSTSMLVDKMRKYAQQENIEVEIKAIGVSTLSEHIPHYDCCLLGPQIRYKLNELLPIAQHSNKPIAVIEMSDYGLMRGDRVLLTALALIPS